MKLLSVIIPVYNVEVYIRECVMSICKQTYSNLEIILVDDGSTDNSPEICDDLGRIDSRIKVIHQKNAGGGAARNKGLSLANGDLIAFVDSDDYVSPYMYEIMIDNMKNDIDIIECDYIEVAESEKYLFQCDLKKSYEVKVFSPEEALAEHINDSLFRQLIWNKVYKKDVIFGILFPEKKGIDDEFWTYKALGNAKRLGLIDNCLYAYRQQNNSVMHTLDAKKRLRALEAKIERHNYIRERYPDLIAVSAVSVWFTALYCGQLVYMDNKMINKKKVFERIHRKLQECVYQDNYKNVLGWKQRFWIDLSKINFGITCIIRTKLRLGL